MGWKLKSHNQFITPAANNYDPKEALTKINPQKAIVLNSQRVDFSKNATGKQVGPGLYSTQR
jgi:hypothetical protein